MHAKSRSVQSNPGLASSGPAGRETVPRSADSVRARSIADACHCYGIGRTFLYEQIRIGALVAQKAGKRTLIATAELERWFAGLPQARESKLRKYD